MAYDKIIIKGAAEHNLKNIDLEIPRDKLIVITGISGPVQQAVQNYTSGASADTYSPTLPNQPGSAGGARSGMGGGCGMGPGRGMGMGRGMGGGGKGCGRRFR